MAPRARLARVVDRAPHVHRASLDHRGDGDAPPRRDGDRLGAGALSLEPLGDARAALARTAPQRSHSLRLRELLPDHLSTADRALRDGQARCVREDGPRPDHRLRRVLHHLRALPRGWAALSRRGRGRAGWAGAPLRARAARAWLVARHGVPVVTRRGVAGCRTVRAPPPATRWP